MEKPKVIKVQVPDGYEIDKEKSTFEIIVFKEVKKDLTYDDTADSLFTNKPAYFTISSLSSSTYIVKNFELPEEYILDSLNSKTNEQLKAILALNKLCNVAKYLNGDWTPDKGRNGNNWFLLLQYDDMLGMYSTLTVSRHGTVQYSCVYFKTKELAKQAIEILGEKEIRKALTLNY